MKAKYALFEVLFSATLLAIAGVFIVYMFTLAEVTQNKARDLDNAVLAAQRAVEQFRESGVYVAETHFNQAFEPADAARLDGFSLELDVLDKGKGFFIVDVTVRKNQPYILGNAKDNIILTLATNIYRGDEAS